MYEERSIKAAIGKGGGGAVPLFDCLKIRVVAVHGRVARPKTPSHIYRYTSSYISAICSSSNGDKILQFDSLLII
jgi:hypothetical protein